uniref:Non-specific serine/threonine protein kinase n=1 Tax=Caenorhabditis tropicalis TaxID=1561998 RepID=A0A1I7TGS0_9PELO
MSKYLKPPNDLLTQEILLDSLQRYVLIKLAPVIRQYNSTPLKQSVDDDGKKIIQKILDNSDHQLRMYGPAEELAENLKIFRDFPFSHEYFEADRIISSPVVYNNLKGEKFISKLDLIMVLQNMAIEISPGQNREHTLISLIRMLREHIQKYSSLLEFVKFDEKWFEEIEKQMREVDKLCPVYEFDFAQVKRQLASGDFTQIISKVPRFGSKPRTEAKEAEMCGVLKTFNSILGPVCRAEQINNFFTNAILLETLATIIEENSETFFKNSVTAVRVFEDGSQRFVMKAELFNAISNGNKFKDDEIAITTISMKEVEGIYGHRVKHVEFLRTPIIRARHRAVRVRGYVEEEYCSLASDAFFEFFRTLIIGEKIFQICTNLDFLVTDIYGKLEDLFKLDRKTPFFVRDETTETWKMRFDGELEMKLKTKNRAKDIGNAKIDGFTLQNLKNELIHLGLTNAFPEIVNHAEVVYLAVDGIKKGKYLSTSDLFEAVFHSQLICIFNRYPRFKTFLHNQSGCGRVLGYTCDLCQKTSEQKELEALKSEKKLLQKHREARKINSDDGNFSYGNTNNIRKMESSEGRIEIVLHQKNGF